MTAQAAIEAQAREVYYELVRNDYGYRPSDALTKPIAEIEAWLAARPDHAAGYGLWEYGSDFDTAALNYAVHQQREEAYWAEYERDEAARWVEYDAEQERRAAERAEHDALSAYDYEIVGKRANRVRFIAEPIDRFGWPLALAA